MKYRARKISNVEEYLSGAIGDNGMRPVWNLHSVIPCKIVDGECILWLVILQNDDDYKPDLKLVK